MINGLLQLISFTSSRFLAWNFIRVAPITPLVTQSIWAPGSDHPFLPLAFTEIAVSVQASSTMRILREPYRTQVRHRPSTVCNSCNSFTSTHVADIEVRNDVSVAALWNITMKANGLVQVQKQMENERHTNESLEVDRYCDERTS